MAWPFWELKPSTALSLTVLVWKIVLSNMTASALYAVVLSIRFAWNSWSTTSIASCFNNNWANVHASLLTLGMRLVLTWGNNRMGCVTTVTTLPLWPEVIGFIFVEHKMVLIDPLVTVVTRRSLLLANAKNAESGLLWVKADHFSFGMKNATTRRPIAGFVVYGDEFQSALPITQ